MKMYYNHLVSLLKDDSKSLPTKILLVFLSTIILLPVSPRPLSQYDLPKPAFEVPLSLVLDVPVKANIHRKTPLAIAHYLWKNFSIESDQKRFGVQEYWQTSAEFQQNKRGDCEDFSLFARELLKQNGYPAFLFNVYGAASGHTVVVFKEGSLYKVLDSDRILGISARDFRDLPKKINPFWRSAAIVTYGASPKAGRILKMFYPR